MIAPMNLLWHQALAQFYPGRDFGPNIMSRVKRAPVQCALIAVLLIGGTGLISESIYIKAKAVVAQVLLHRAWTATLADPANVPVKPWRHADTWPVARLSVARLGIDQIVLAGASGRTLAFGPAHSGDSAMPGRAGNSVISGHRDTHFSFLDELEIGDEVVVTTRDGQALRYRVVSAQVVHIDDVAIELITPTRQMTLVTCYPLDAIDPGTPWRYLVTTELIANPDRIAGQLSGGTWEPEPIRSTASAFASAPADTGKPLLGQDMGGLPDRLTLPGEPERAITEEAFATPLVRDG